MRIFIICCFILPEYLKSRPLGAIVSFGSEIQSSSASRVWDNYIEL